ncbi:MAG: acyl-CoA dehydrogenase family protein [Acidimicrobiia bacterium]|nr:acyl-CoA dehydrogenase family protein [Acidimicrobiia bacterium]
MDPRYPPEAEAFRGQVRSFLAEHLPADWWGIGALDPEDATAFVASWRRTLYEHRLLGLAWPTEYGGGGRTKLEQVILAEECARAMVPLGPPSDTVTVKMIGNTVLRWGTEEQKRYFIPRILSGADTWCQGFSEPDAGSDLAAVRTSAVLDGDEWVINGQKIWTSFADRANWIFVLARTDPSAEKHKGLSFLLCPVDQPGIEVRPIAMTTGQSDFNEVFFENARTPAHNILGEMNGGWAVAMSLLGHERGEEAAVNPIMFRHELDRLFELARAYGRDRDPLVRQRLAWCYTKVETMRYLGLRILNDYLQEGELGPAASISKLYWSEYHREAANLAMDVMGPAGLVPEGHVPPRPYRTDDPGAPNSTASWTHVFMLNAMAGTVYAGTSQVQRSIIGEVLLGLPKEAPATP